MLRKIPMDRPLTPGEQTQFEAMMQKRDDAQKEADREKTKAALAAQKQREEVEALKFLRFKTAAALLEAAYRGNHPHANGTPQEVAARFMLLADELTDQGVIGRLQVQRHEPRQVDA